MQKEEEEGAFLYSWDTLTHAELWRRQHFRIPYSV